jgi:Flp pilus assembly protein TadD
MSVAQVRAVFAALAALLLLSGCETSTKLGDLFASSKSGETTGAIPGAASAAATAPAITGSVAPSGSASNNAGLLGSDPNDDLSLGKKQFRAGNFALAERHFRRATELHSQDAEAWVGLAASYDQLRRFELADRAYRQAIELIGPTPELLNNQGYSYMLRGDYVRARTTLKAAQTKDPDSPYIQNNLELLEKSARRAKGIQ